MTCILTRRRGTRRRGATTVELAIIFPVLILVVALIFEMGRVMMVQQNLAFAAQQGSRKASLATTLTESQVAAVVRTSLQPVIPRQASVVDVQVKPAGLAGISPGAPIIVNASVALSDVSCFPGTILDLLGNPTLSASAIQDRE
jgi:Flp pilus assembly protein TadG